ncbi:MAG: hypothetical protein ACRETO_03790 [Gammaproteobacteria bacterium]
MAKAMCRDWGQTMIRLLVGMIVVLVALCAAFGGLLWHERSQMGRQDCEISAAARANADTQNTADVQHQADQHNIEQLQTQIAKLQIDADAAAHLNKILRAKLVKQIEVLKHVHDTDTEARRCLDSGVPDSLLDSLHPATGGATDQTGQSGGI